MTEKHIIYNYLAIKDIKGISNKTIINIVRNTGTLRDIFQKSQQELIEYGCSEFQSEQILTKKYNIKTVEEELKNIEKYNIKIISYEDNGYPLLLKETQDAPSHIYVYGNEQLLSKPSISIVGSRKASSAALRFTKKIAADLAESGFNIVSGFAAGIDINAHIGALEKGTTTAVFGNGLLVVYPESNKKYIKEIIDKGVLISEFPLFTKPLAHNFPQRNRIISGLSHGVLVIEASNHSGSFITAQLALENNRDVFAVPVWPDNFNNGTNKLIKNGAKLVESYIDIVEDYTSLINFPEEIDKNKYLNNISFSNSTEEKIFNMLRTNPATCDEIYLKIDEDVSDIMSALSNMEIEDIIYSGNDGKYYINGR